MQLQVFDGTVPKATGPQESIVKPYRGSEGNLTFCYITTMNNKCKITRVYQKAKYKKGLGGSWFLRGKWGHFAKFLYISMALLSLGKRSTVESSYKDKPGPGLQAPLDLRQHSDASRRRRESSLQQACRANFINSSMNTRKILANEIPKNILFRKYDKEE